MQFRVIGGRVARTARVEAKGTLVLTLTGEEVFSLVDVPDGHGLEVFFQFGDRLGCGSDVLVRVFGDVLEGGPECGVVDDVTLGGVLVESFLYPEDLRPVVVDVLLRLLDPSPRHHGGLLLGVVQLVQLVQRVMVHQVMLFEAWV